MTTPLLVYLRDHLTGANFAVELLETWIEDEPLPGVAAWAKPLRDEIAADRELLKEIIARLGETTSTMKEKLGWLAEKASRLKLSHHQPPALAHFEGLEVLALGILGKVSLWEALRLLAPDDTALLAFDYGRLLERAHAQHAGVEGRRRQFVRLALTSH